MTELSNHRPITTIKEELRDAHAAAHRLERELTTALTAESPVKVGDIVKVSSSRDGTSDCDEALVVRVDVLHWVTPHIRVVLRKKDGTWGKAERAVYGTWEVIGHEDGAQ